MGTNYYFETKNMIKAKEEINTILRKHTVHNEVNTEILITDIEDFIDRKCRIHICKTSAYWNPMIWGNTNYKTLDDIQEFYDKNKEKLIIIDEYGTEVSLDWLIRKMYDFRNKAVYGLENDGYYDHIDRDSGFRVTYDEFS